MVRDLSQRVLAALMALLATLASAAAQSPSSITLQPGEYLWLPELAGAGPVVMLVSLPQQLAFVYRNGVRIGITTISSGRPGYETPTGVFRILQKRREHYSNLYDSAPMPYMQRLTWDGVALHAGHITGAPASHGCIRLPETFARKLFELTTTGMIVVVADREVPAPVLAYPGFLAPVEPESGLSLNRLGSADEGYLWQPERAPEGPLSIIISSADQALVVSRQGVEIGRSDLRIPADVHFGLHAFVMLEGHDDQPHPLLAGRQAHRWQSLTLPDHNPPGHREFDIETVQGLGLSPDFVALLDAALLPGTTVVVTDEPLGTDSAQVPALLRTDEAENPGPVPPG
ncbi:MAG: L,D-transpeptidase family protein [Lysobacterales bacterium]